MCLLEKLYQKAEDSGFFDLDASLDTEELDLQVSEDAVSAVVAVLHCVGGERGAFLSHATSSLRLQSELHPDGETWAIMPVPEDCTFAIMCCGQTRGLFLAHYQGEVYLTPNLCDLSPLSWYVQKQWGGYTISCYSNCSWMYLSHACGRVFLQKAFLGAGELWQLWTEQVARSDIKCCFPSLTS